MALLLNMLSRLVVIFLPRSKHLLISWLQSPSAVILEPKKINSATVSTFVATVEVAGPAPLGHLAQGLGVGKAEGGGVVEGGVGRAQGVRLFFGVYATGCEFPGLFRHGILPLEVATAR